MNYARFYKCDLHMHSPLDFGWMEEETKLNLSDNDERKREVAREYLIACHKTGLEVIAITDHNFAPRPVDSFINYLEEEKEDVAKSLGVAPIIIFPGFEIQAHVGKGVHILCLFEPNTPLTDLDHCLTQLKLAPPKRYREKHQPTQTPSGITLDKVLEVVQKSDMYKGIVILPHILGDKGVFDNNKVTIPYQSSEFRKPEILCCEINKPIEDIENENVRKILRADKDCLEEWKRDRPIACIVSSDSKRIKEKPGEKNYIGCRSTWIKMSQPSIESLRQAFLDHESRVELSEVNPDKIQKHPRINSVLIRGTKFLRNFEEIRFSPNLNCLIGSRGTGKSTLINYIRIALDIRSHYKETERYLMDLFEDTLSKDSQIELKIETIGGEYRIICTVPPSGDLSSMKTEVYPPGSDSPDPRQEINRLFPCRILSQREIELKISDKDKSPLTNFLDDFIDFDALRIRAVEKENQLRMIEQELVGLREKQERRKELETKKTELTNFLNSQKFLQDILTNWNDLEQENLFFDALVQEIKDFIKHWQREIDEAKFASFLPVYKPKDTSLNAVIIENIEQIVTSALSKFKESVTKALTTFSNEVKGEVKKQYKIWQPTYKEMQEKIPGIRDEAQAQGFVADEVELIPPRLQAVNQELAILDTDLKNIENLEVKRQGVLRDLREIWREETAERKKKASELMDNLRYEKKPSKSRVEIQIEHQASKHEIVELMANIIRDKRGLNVENLKALVDNLFDLLRKKKKSDLTWIELLIEEVKKGNQSRLLKDTFLGYPTRLGNFLSIYTIPVLQDFEAVRISDSITYIINRPDGTKAGFIEKVSLGQQGNAILNLLLASGKGPLIIDTPEEGLDNEVVYTELVKLFREVKKRRQIIVATHNANIPVNADAEQIIALEAAGFVEDEDLDKILEKANLPLSDGEKESFSNLLRWQDWEDRIRIFLDKRNKKGKINVELVLKMIGERRDAEGRVKHLMIEGAEEEAVGGLDRKGVTLAVQNIMEGSEEAFKRRWEKYGF